MRKIDFVNELHKILILDYIHLLLGFVTDVSTKQKLKEYEEILDLLLEYHNSYKIGTHVGNWQDFLFIIPINLSLLTQAYLSAIRTKRNSNQINSFKFLIGAKTEEIIKSLIEIEPINE